MRFAPVCVILCLLSFAPYSTGKKIDFRKLKCLVCMAAMEEIEWKVHKVNPSSTIGIGNYHMDTNGDIKYKKIPYARSEAHLFEVLENVCEQMDDYARATKKDDGSLVLVRLITHDRKMNPAMPNVDIIQDEDLNRSLRFLCESMVGEYEDTITRLYTQNSTDAKDQVCYDESNLCIYYKPHELIYGDFVRKNDEL